MLFRSQDLKSTTNFNFLSLGSAPLGRLNIKNNFTHFGAKRGLCQIIIFDGSLKPKP